MDKRVFYTIWLISIVWMVWLMFVDAEDARKKKNLQDQQAALVDKMKGGAEEAPKGEATPDGANEVAPAEPPVETVDQLTLGVDEKNPQAKVVLEASLTNRGAAVREMFLNRFLDEHRQGRLRILNEETPGTLSYVLRLEGDDTPATKNWKVETNTPQEVSFVTTARGGAIEIRKKFLLEEGAQGARLVLEFTGKSDKPIADVRYWLTGGNGVPIEGAWYTRFFRSTNFFLRASGSSGGELKQELASAIVSNEENGQPQISFSKTPMQWGGVGSQYFASLLVQPFDIAAHPEQNQVGQAMPQFISLDPKNSEMSNIGVEVRSVPLILKPGETVRHEYLLYNGPKEESVLDAFGPFQLREVIHFPPFFFIPVAFFSKALTSIVRGFEYLTGDFGVAIILMTLMVRMLLFPLNYWQTRTMSRMQAIQPLMEQIRKESGNNMEEYGRKIRELQTKHNVNPYTGCLPLFIQFPILVGLWQGLATDFHLRQAPLFYGLTWVHDLSAPDMLFRWPFDISFINSLLGPYFNLLPIISLVQLILVMLMMSPPATSPDAAMMKKVMVGMMVFMSFMFYKVPSGLCVYIITGSLWGMLERKFMPKPQLSPQLKELTDQAKSAALTPSTPADTSWKKSIDGKKPARKP